MFQWLSLITGLHSLKYLGPKTKKKKKKRWKNCSRCQGIKQTQERRHLDSFTQKWQKLNFSCCIRGPSNNTREDSTHGHHQMVNTEIRLIIFFAAKDGEALYNQQKQDRELTVAQIINSLLPNSDLNRRKQGKPLDHSGMTLIKSLMIIQWK